MGAPFAVVLAALALSGCNTLEAATTPDVTNATAAGFEKISAGSEQDFIVNVGRRTYFAKGSAALDDTAKMTLDSQAEFLKANPNWYAKIQGFADDPGEEAANVALSQKRADAVMAYLVSKGVAPDRLWAKGYGMERLVRDCDDIECKAQNRRAVTNLREEKEA
ncbi:OmpA family protein [Hongsoonwoonella zoysiae]|uniref:OmpA family protein n=1 Tax=Hongsoonwoonella zoysiae TaxID=2821844 RepID=UPI003CCCDF05